MRPRNFPSRLGSGCFKPLSDVASFRGRREKILHPLRWIVEVAFVVSEADQHRTTLGRGGFLNEDVGGHGIVEATSVSDVLEDPLKLLEKRDRYRRCLFQGLRRRTVVILHEGRDEDWAHDRVLVTAEGCLERVSYRREVIAGS